MKKVILFFATLLTLSACELNVIEFEDQMYYDDVYGKWTFYSTSATATGCYSIELTEGRYFFARKSDGSIAYGKYSKTDNFQFTFDGFAVIDVTEYSSDSFKFDITFDGAAEAISASAYIGDGAEDSADEDYQFDDNVYAVWEVSNIYYDNCGCTCGEDCSCQNYIGPAVCTGCNCLCNENRVGVKYMLLSSSGALITIDSNGDTEYYTWYWQDNISTDGVILINNHDDVEIVVTDVATQSLRIDYTHPNGYLYDVWFTCKSSGQLDI